NYMIIIGFVKTCGCQATFLFKTLRSLTRAGESPKILVSVSADYSIPAHALWAYRTEGARLQLAVVDLCETPLALCRWYAERQGAEMATHCRDVRDHEPSTPVDVVFTNSFLGNFDPDGRSRLFAGWRRPLRPGAQPLFTNRLRPGAPE